MASAWAVSMFVLSVLIEGRTGAFVGKWLCGLRVVRTTLRPCNMSRILLRELLLCVDTANLLSPIPAVFAILSNEQRQRIGDLVADTIVVEHRAAESVAARAGSSESGDSTAHLFSPEGGSK